MHKDLQIAHKDIKPPNILLDQNYKQFKLADFGTSQDFSENPFDWNLAGTRPYVSPEIYF